MDHPLIGEDHTSLRKRVIQFLKTGLAVQRTSNIIFLCGGNDSEHLRTLFKRYCEQSLSEYEIFLPEAAMNSIFSDELREPFDLADFEELVGEISYAIVVFPEGPGSYAETGYFSAIPTISQKCILVLNHNMQQNDSFISLGPAKKISENSIFHPNINLDYLEPHFETIAERIRSRRLHKTKKSLILERFSDLSPYETAAILHTIVSLCSIATATDIYYLVRSIFRNQFSITKVRKLLSVLVGSEYLLPVGDYGHFTSNDTKQRLTTVRDGFRNTEAELRLSLANIYQDGDEEFLQIIRDSSGAD